MSDDREFTQIGELEKLPDDELEKLVIGGVNLHIHTSKASIAKQVLENRRQKKQTEAAEDIEVVAKQLKESHRELLTIVTGLDEIVKILNFLKTHWFPNKPLWVKVSAFIAGTVILGIALNLAANWIAKFLLNW